MNAKVATEESSLLVADALAIRDDLGLNDNLPAKFEDEEVSKLDAQAMSVVESLMSLDPSNFDSAQSGKNAVETMGFKVQKDSAHRSQMLREPIAKLSQRAEDGGEVANALIDLKMKVEELDPANFDFEAGWLSRTLGWLPVVGKPIKRYFTRFESAQTVLSAISNSLNKGKDQLNRDNITLLEDQRLMRELTRKLEKHIALGIKVDEKLVYQLDREIKDTDPKHKFIQEEILFPLRQRIQDLQQQMVVNQQGFIAIEVIIRNNKELVRGVDRSLNVTMSALQVAVTLALALANQKIVLDKINALNKTTDDLIAGTAKRLKEQGVEIHKQAASTSLNVDTLKQAFVDIRAALDDVSKFRQAALPKMAQTIKELNEMTVKQDEAINDLEKGNKASSSFQISIE